MKKLPGKKKERKLTTKERMFVAEYEKDWNASRAAVAVGYSEKSAAKLGSRLVHKSGIVEEIQKRIDGRLRKMGVERERFFKEVTRIAYSDIGKLFNEDGSLKNPSEMDEDTRAALSSIQVLEEFEGSGESRSQIGWTKKIRMWDKTKALEFIGKHLHLFNGDRDGDDRPNVIFQTININKPANSGLSEE